jgi:formylglycine-generating enzyme required for sulfatase activity
MALKFIVHYEAVKNGHPYDGEIPIIAETEHEAIQEFGGIFHWEYTVTCTTWGGPLSPAEAEEYYNKKKREEEISKARVAAQKAAEQKEKEAFRQSYKETTGKDISLSDVVWDNGKWAYDGDVKAAKAKAEAEQKEKVEAEQKEKETFRQSYKETTGKDISLSDVVWDNGKWAYDGDVKAAAEQNAKAVAEQNAKKAAAKRDADKRKVARKRTEKIIFWMCIITGAIIGLINGINAHDAPGLYAIMYAIPGAIIGFILSRIFRKAKKRTILIITAIVAVAAITGVIIHSKTEEYADTSFDSANFVLVPAGTFAMGRGGEEADERPEHEVTLTKFYISKWEVTQAEYKELMGTNPSHFKGVSLPVESVTWYDAIEYCNARSEKEGLKAAYSINKDESDPNNKNEDDSIKWTVTWDRKANGYRLPTEAEWEYSCRAGTTSQYGSNDLGTYFEAHPKEFFHFGAKRTKPVGGFSNAWRISSILGNVWEWCWDWEGPYSSAAQTDPAGASSGEYREQRGGGWNDKNLTTLRSANRGRVNPAAKGSTLGFRLVRNGE